MKSVYLMRSKYNGEIVETPQDFVTFFESIKSRLSSLHENYEQCERILSDKEDLMSDDDVEYHRNYMAQLSVKIQVYQEIIYLFPIMWVKAV